MRCFVACGRSPHPGGVVPGTFVWAMVSSLGTFLGTFPGWVPRMLGGGVDVVAGGDQLWHEIGLAVRAGEMIAVDFELLGAGDRSR